MRIFILGLILAGNHLYAAEFSQLKIEPSQATAAVIQIASEKALNQIVESDAHIVKVSASSGKYQIGQFGEYSVKVLAVSPKTKKSISCHGTIAVIQGVIVKHPENEMVLESADSEDPQRETYARLINFICS
jgi:hypothetical protein